MSGLYVGRDSYEWHSRTEAVLVEGGRRQVIVKPAEVIPHQENCGAVAVRSTQYRVYILHGPVLALACAVGGVLAGNSRYQPTHRWEIAGLRVRNKLRCW